jgi:hypothetical protein
MIRGSVDTISSKRATGWIYSDESREPLTVEAQINDQVVGRALANVLRSDLRSAGLGDGKCGFELRFENELDSLYLPFVQVMLADTDLEVRRWAGAGFRDYFRALYQRYPRTGRSASVFGGLWTDRTDASAVLKGRTDIGIVAARDANGLARFIQDGAVVLASDPATGRSVKSDVVHTVAQTMFGGEILNMMRAVLDDNPVAVRADVLNADEPDFIQMSALEELPSPAECLGVVFPVTEQPVSVDIIRGGHRFPEFLADGLSRWTHTAPQRHASATLSSDLPVDRHQIRKGTAMLIGPGALCRIREACGGAIRVLALPSRLSLLRFQQKAPRGEVAHESGARVWV